MSSQTSGNWFYKREIMASNTTSLTCDVAVLGAGPGGYSAAFRAADLGLDTILIDRWPTLGGVCLNVGCIPSKALLHVAALIESADGLASHGVAFGKPAIDLPRLRNHKSAIVGKLTSGLTSLAKARKVRVVQGTGTFTTANSLLVTGGDGEPHAIQFSKAIIAAGSEAQRLPFLPEDPRIVDSTGALELPSTPQRMLVIGGGIIGLEMATIYAALGATIDIAELTGSLMPGADRDLVRAWEKFNARRFRKVMLGTKVVSGSASKDGITIQFEGPNTPATETYDLVLVAVGRSPNGRQIGAEKAGVAVSDRGFISIDRQMRTNVPHIFAIGDIACAPMLAHKAVHEGHLAAEAAAGKPSFFDAAAIPSVAYTDPEIAWVGKTEDDLKTAGAKFEKAVFPWAASGRAIANGRSEGFTKLLFDGETHRLVGGGIAGVNAGDLIGEICLAIEMGADAADIGKTIHPHPTLGESIGLAAEVAEGICTELLPPRRR